MDAAYAGKVIDGRYEVLGVLGEGGMGVVLRARHKFTGHEVALKVLRAEIALNHDARARFMAEAQAPAAIGHPAIVSITDAGASPEGLYFAMKLLKGEPLATAISRGVASLGWTRLVLVQLLDALGAAHSAGFIHRDLKPANVFLVGNTAAPSVKLLDFGIAKVMSQAVEAKGQTAMGSVMGTLAYMSPEQLSDSSLVDARTDLWAVGVMVFEMLSGALPYQARSFAEMFLAIRTGPPRSLRSLRGDVSRELEAFISRALSVDPNGRFGSAAEMRAALVALPDPLANMSTVQPPAAMQLQPALPQHPPSVIAAPTPQTGGAFAVSAPPQVPTTGAAVPRTGRSWVAPVAVAGALVALCAAAVALYFALSMKPPPTASSREDDTPTRRAAVPDPTSAPTATPKTNACEQGCALLLGPCGARVDSNCASRCEGNAVGRSCTEEALTKPDRCDELALCAWETVCNARIDPGNGSCQQAMMCQVMRPGDLGCACLEGISPASALFLWRNDACAQSSCTAECSSMSTPMICAGCATRRCPRENGACAAH